MLVFTLHHDLSFRDEGAKANTLELFDAEEGAWAELHADTGLAALGVGDGVDVAVFAGVLGKLGRAGASRAVNKIEVYALAEAVEVVKKAFVGDLVVLPALKTAAEAGLEDGVVDGKGETGTTGVELIFVGVEDFAKELQGEDAVLKLIEDAHNAGHIDALFVCCERDGACDGSFENECIVFLGEKLQREAEIGDADLEDGHIGTENAGGAGILHVGKAVFVASSHFQAGIVFTKRFCIACSGGIGQDRCGVCVHDRYS